MPAICDEAANEIDRLKDEAFQREARVMMYISLISSLERQLAALQLDCEDAERERDEWKAHAKLNSQQCKDYQHQLSEARAEVEEVNKELKSAKHAADSFFAMYMESMRQLAEARVKVEKVNEMLQLNQKALLKTHTAKGE